MKLLNLNRFRIKKENFHYVLKNRKGEYLGFKFVGFIITTDLNEKGRFKFYSKQEAKEVRKAYETFNK